MMKHVWSLLLMTFVSVQEQSVVVAFAPCTVTTTRSTSSASSSRGGGGGVDAAAARSLSLSSSSSSSSSTTTTNSNNNNNNTEDTTETTTITTNQQQEKQQGTQDSDTILRFTLPKPLGVVLEEVVEGAAQGVTVAQVGESGSAAPYANDITGCQLWTVMGIDVTQASFDTVMNVIGDAPDTAVDLEFAKMTSCNNDKDEDWAVGTVVTVVAERDNGQDDLVFQAAVGDNLRQALLDNGFEVYQGMKQKLGNCGGGGSCTFCAVDIIESQGWPERSDYENSKLAKNPNARLACLNPIQGPVKLRKAKR